MRILSSYLLLCQACKEIDYNEEEDDDCDLPDELNIFYLRLASSCTYADS
jgi:hypothetical protein